MNYKSFILLIPYKMKPTQLEAVKTIIKELEKSYDFNDLVLNYVEEKNLIDCEDAKDVHQLLQDANEDYEITDTEVIYFSNAMEYLSENDPSLRGSTEIAYEYGYAIDKLNSELLASLHKSRQNQEDYNTFCDEVMTKIESDGIFA